MNSAHARGEAALVAVLACLATSLFALMAFVTAAGAASGDLAWHRTYNRPANGADVFLAAAAAPNGGVYVAGKTFIANDDFLVARFDASGHRRWLRTYNGPAAGNDSASSAATDGSGNLVVAGSANGASIAIAKYTSSGQRRWARVYDAPMTDEAVTDVAIDGTGNTYVLAWTYSVASTFDMIVLKYSPAGARRWVRHFAGPVPAGDDHPSGIATDNAGNVYVVGSSPGVGTGLDIVTLKYDPAGHRRWARRWDGPAGGPDQGYAIAVSGAGAVYVAGRAAGISSGQDAAVLKYTRNGALQWSRLRTSSGVFGDSYLDLTLLGNGDVAAVGSYYGGPANDADVLLVRLSPTGQTRWARGYNAPDSLADAGRHLAQGPTGTLYVAAESAGMTTSGDFLTLKYNGAGALRWAKRYSSAGAAEDAGSALVVRSASVYVAGWQSAVSGIDATLLRYRP